MNMSYCRFQNTLGELEDCLDHFEDDDLSELEARARKCIIQICRDIVFVADKEGE